MSYQAAKEIKLKAERNHNEAAEYLKAVSGNEKGPMGLTPDHIKQTAEWQEAYIIERQAFEKLRTVNKFMTKNFRKEMRNDPDFNFRLRVA